MAFWKRSSGNYRLARLFTHSIFLTISVLTVVVLLQNYQVNRQVVTQEVARSKQQTSSLVQEIFNFRLESIELLQDSYSRSIMLADAIRERKTTDIDHFFLAVDQIDTDISPDFRFISRSGHLLWADGNNQFYGIKDEQLMHISTDMVTGNEWYLSQTPSSMGTRYLLVRRTSLVSMQNGEVLGDVFAGLVLNDNFALTRALLKGSNVDDIALSVGSEVIATSIKDSKRHIEWLEQYSPQLNANKYMVSRTDLTINGVATFLSVYTIQNNSHIALMMRGHYAWVAVAIISILIIALYSRYWLSQRVSKELQNLMLYTEQSVEAQRVEPFDGSSIAEFNKIGQSFQRSFKRLSEQEKQFADLFNFSISPITLWDTSGSLLRMNPAAERSFRSDDPHQDNYQFLLDKLMPQIRMCAHGAALTGINLTIGDNTYRWNLSPIVIDNTTRYVIAQGQDVTSFVEAEKQSQMARLEAEESARARADFLAKMSHELRTPLNGILGVSQLLKGKLSDSNDIEHVEVLVNSGEHLLAVLNDILDFSKIEQGKFHIQHSEFRLQELLSAVEKIYRPLCHDKNIELEVYSNIPSDLVGASDQVRLNQVLFNLVSNAVKFTHQGHVRVELILDRKQEVPQLEILIEDTGIGIDKQRLAHIFDPFVQAEATTTREYGGSGLGLAIVYNLVELLDGSIQVSSEIGKGSRFVVILPLEVVENAAELTSGELLESPETMFDRDLNVLLVEDNHTNAFIARAFCEKYGMKVTWVTDGYNAIEHLKDNPNVDLILMDNQLPNLGGIETTKIIRHDLAMNVPIYACTADGMQDTKRSFLTVGADYVIIKPIKEIALNQAFIHYKQNFYLPAKAE
ncbi:quorum-sensing autoinducer 2 sensor kinase/phosphatase LuxQ [Vibrio sp. LaRot3]|uniref:quorum-sensing autoinducer 2 sensor kinase/phosphatase LuxQ n=1 Tax=Vibrio sp. LaRot3 TaxID=2998829 RepID=UPI0022CDF14A|nr:quorum-sensing autoinducer 2 sensor kinase/phosphatase LuxQ [Vibrio sp. LaRot3]MDA0148381.1 ATP-binding protein [Vibrio sp. LaRot3]